MRREAGREAWHLKGSQMNAAREVRGSVVFPLTEQIRNTIDTHGAQWAFLYYAARMPAAEAVVLLLQCATLFRHYEALHLAKGTADGNEKAARNKAIADRVMQFLDRTQQDGGGV